MIRTKIEEYYSRKISFEELKNYTLPKYADGVNALDYFVFAGRYLKDNPLLFVGSPELFDLNAALKDTVKHNLKLGIIKTSSFFDTYIYVLSPIKLKNKILGYDLIYFDNSKVLEEIADKNIDFKIYNNFNGDYVSFDGEKLSQSGDNQLIYRNNKVFFQIKSKSADLFYEFSIAKKILFTDFYLFYKNQFIIIALLVISLSLTIFTLYRREKFFYMKKMIEHERKYYWMLENSGDAIVIRQNGRFTFANYALSHMLGYSKEELLSMNYRETFPKKTLLEIEKIIKENEDKNHTKYRYEITLFKKDGTKIDVEVNENIIEFNNDKAYFAVIRDITKQKEFIKILQKGSEQAKALNEFIPICANCSRIRDDEHKSKPWEKPADYISERLPDIQFSHTLCPDCIKELYPDLVNHKQDEENDN